MSFMLSSVYDSTEYSSSVDGPIYGYDSDVNQGVGYKWYQRSPSSDTPEMNFLTAQPWCCTPQFSLSVQQVSDSSLYYPNEYRPPPTPPHVFHPPEPPPTQLDNNVISAPQLFEKSSEREPICVDKSFNSEGLNNAFNVTEEVSSMETIEVGIPSDKLANNMDNSVLMDNLRTFQNSCSVMEYVDEFMYIKSRAEFICKCDIEDNLLAYCFVVGLKDEIRDALELWSPQTLQEAIHLAKLQESLLEESLLVENLEMKSDKGLKELELQVETRVNALTNGVNVFSGETHKDENRNILVGVNDLQKQITKNVSVNSSLNVMQILNQTRAATNANYMDKRFGNVRERNRRNFDPGGITTPVSIFSIEEGFVELVLEVHVMSSINADVSTSYDYLLPLQFSILKNPATTFIPPGCTSHESAFCRYCKVMEVDIKVRNKEKRKGMLKGGDEEREDITKNVFEISSSLKLVDNNGDIKWCEIGEENGVVELGLCVIGEFSGWACVSMTYGLEHAIAAAWDLTLALFDGRISNQYGRTEVQNFNDILRRYKAPCKVASAIDHVFTVNLLAAYPDGLITDHFHLSQALVLKFKTDPEPHISECLSKSACISDLFRDVSPNFDKRAIYEHHLKGTGRFMHERVRAPAEFFNILGDTLMTNQPPRNATWGGSLFSFMGDKSTRASIYALSRILGEDARISVKCLYYELRRTQWKPGLLVRHHSKAVQSPRTLMVIVVELLQCLVDVHTEVSAGCKRLQDNFFGNDSTTTKQPKAGVEPRIALSLRVYPPPEATEQQQQKVDQVVVIIFVLPRMLWRPGISFTDRSEARQLQGLTSTLHFHTQRLRLLIQKFQRHDLRGAAIQPSSLSQIWNASTLAIVEMRFLAWYWNALCLVFDPGDCDYLKCSQILSFLRTRMFLRGRECNGLDILKVG